MKKNWYVITALVFFNLVFVLGVAISVYTMLASLWIIMGSFLASPFILAAVNFLGIQSFSLINTLASFLLFVIGVVLIPICQRATKFLLKISTDYINYNKKLAHNGLC